VGEAVVGVSATAVTVGDGTGTQPFNTRVRTVARGIKLVTFLIVPSK
jgi:hypothetical protein